MDSEHISLSRRIVALTAAEKIKLALLGNKEARTVLIKDPNKLVATSVLKNPKITEPEIVEIAQSRRSSEDALRMIANNKGWTRNYKVKCGLVNNPRTPIGVALRFIPHLILKDIKSLSKNKNVPNVITTVAKNALQSRGKH